MIIVLNYLCFKNKYNQCYYYQYYISKNKDDSAKTKKYMNNSRLLQSTVLFPAKVGHIFS